MCVLGKVLVISEQRPSLPVSVTFPQGRSMGRSQVISERSMTKDRLRLDLRGYRYLS